ncbi:hypothetical protein ABVT39_016969 [Epinephelus coioides]
MEENHIRFLVVATYDVLPIPQNLKLWVNEDPSCPLCSRTATLKHILSGCKVSLSQGRYTWQYNQVLKCLAAGIEGKRRQVNSEGVKDRSLVIQFVRVEGLHINLCAQPVTAGIIYLAVVERTEEGRRFISEDRKEGDVYDTLHLETRSQNTEKLSVDQAATVLLNFLQQAREGADENPDEVYFQELPVWKREYF